jgi:hypothetical protein
LDIVGSHQPDEDQDSNLPVLDSESLFALPKTTIPSTDTNDPEVADSAQEAIDNSSSCSPIKVPTNSIRRGRGRGRGQSGGARGTHGGHASGSVQVGEGVNLKRKVDGNVSGPKLKKPRTALPPPRETSKRCAIK